MRLTILGLFSVAAFAFAGSALAVDEKWKDGMLFVEEKIASVVGHTAFKIVFGLEPGKCTGEITAVSEWLIMREGTLVQTYRGKGDFSRKKGDEWYQPNGTKVVICNKSGQRGILEGVQFRPK